MPSEDQLPLHERDIDGVRNRLTMLRQLLADQLAPFGAGSDIVDELLTACDEWGAAHVRSLLEREPSRFGLSGMPARKVMNAGQLLEQLTNDNDAFELLVVARETILTTADPSHRRVYPWFGRELVIDTGGRTIRFADSPGPGEPLTITAVPNRHPPTIGPDAVASPTRRRRRERDR